jgi:hypothetical protein
LFPATWGEWGLETLEYDLPQCSEGKDGTEAGKVKLGKRKNSF